MEARTLPKPVHVHAPPPACADFFPGFPAFILTHGFEAGMFFIVSVPGSAGKGTRSQVSEQPPHPQSSKDLQTPQPYFCQDLCVRVCVSE